MKFFVDKEINQFTGDDAERRLKETNDLCFYLEGDGIIKVDIKRWQEAQYYEKKTWLTRCISDKDDRNHQHKLEFENYDFLKKCNILYPDIIELGCGPFTNIRLISQEINAKSLTLLDPLLMDYLHHPNCTYKDGKLNGLEVELINSSIEKYTFEKKYDIVIMMNVLEHCFDIDLIFEKIQSIMKPESLFIFHDCSIKNEYINDIANNFYDSGHPIRLSDKKLEEYLSNFEKVFFKQLYGRYNQYWRIDKYAILKLKS